MYNYTRKYYIHNTEVQLTTLLKYIEIMLTHHNIQPNKLPVSFVDEKIQTKGGMSYDYSINHNFDDIYFSNEIN